MNFIDALKNEGRNEGIVEIREILKEERHLQRMVPVHITLQAAPALIFLVQ